MGTRIVGVAVRTADGVSSVALIEVSDSVVPCCERDRLYGRALVVFPKACSARVLDAELMRDDSVRLCVSVNVCSSGGEGGCIGARGGDTTSSHVALL